MVKIRTVFQPDRVIEVSEAEYLDLKCQNAIRAVVVPKATEPEPEVDSTPTPSKKK